MSKPEVMDIHPSIKHLIHLSSFLISEDIETLLVRVIAI